MADESRKGGYGLRSLGPAPGQKNVDEDSSTVESQSQTVASTKGSSSKKGTSQVKTVRSGYGSAISGVSKSSAFRKKAEEIKALEEISALKEEERNLKSQIEKQEILVQSHQEEIDELTEKLATMSPEEQDRMKVEKDNIEYVKRQQRRQKIELAQMKSEVKARLETIVERKTLIEMNKDLAQQGIDEEESVLKEIDLSDVDETVADRTEQFVNVTVEQVLKQEVALKAAREADEFNLQQQKAAKEAGRLKIAHQQKLDEELAKTLNELENLKVEKEGQAQIVADATKTAVEASEKVKQASEMERKLQEKVKAMENPDKAVPKIPVKETVAGQTENLAENFQATLIAALGNLATGNKTSSDHSKFLARQSTAKDLPNFSGRAEEWPIFKADFDRSTSDCGFSNSENMSRLRKCLKGDAAKYVQSLMVSPDNVPTVLRKLETRFGQPEIIISVMIDKVRMLPKFEEKDLDKFIDFGGAVQNVIATIKTLKLSDHLKNPQLLKELSDKLPKPMLMQWWAWVEASKDRKSDLLNFEEWLDKQTAIACKACPPTQAQENKAENPQEQRIKKKNAPSWMTNEEDLPTAAGLIVGPKTSCIFCGKHSNSANCYTAEKMSYGEKEKLINEKRPCYKCFNINHISRNCQVTVKCRNCEQHHATCMCPSLPSNKEMPARRKEVVPDKRPPTASESIGSTTTTQVTTSSQVLLKTLIVEVLGRFGRKKVRAVLDDGSQRSYILKRLAEDLGLSPVGEEEMRHVVFGGATSGVIKHKKYTVKVQNAFNRGTSCISLLDKGQICRELPRMERGPWMKDLKQKGVWLSDIGEGSPTIQILLGADSLTGIMSKSTLPRQLVNGLVALKTHLGWTLMGRYGGESEESSSSSMMVTDLFHNCLSMDQLWSLEAIGIKDPAEVKCLKENEKKVKSEFLSNVDRNHEGRFVVGLPWIGSKPKIPSNKSEAIQRLESTTQSLLKKKRFEQYSQLFEDWEKEGIIEEVKQANDESNVHYLPHHAVIKLDSTTTPIRPVFDASSKVGRNPSLNECLEKGPNLLELIPSILYRFREKRIGVISDIRKAFQMIEVKEEDRDYLRFLWWEDRNQNKLKVYRHKRVVFGVNASPFILGALLEYILTEFVAKEEQHMGQQLLKSLYVDNCVISVDTIEEAEIFRKWATNILAAGKMDLRMWEGGFEEKSGVNPLTSRGCGLDFGREKVESLCKQITSVLGYRWDKIHDTINCDFCLVELPEKITKKLVLSMIQRVYDPIGFTCPAMLQPKLLMQSLWATKLNWADQIPLEENNEFKKWCSEVLDLRQIKIPRNVSRGQSNRENWQLHVFSDASKLAYAAVVFLRVEVDKKVEVQLMAAKARVAPLHKTSINRLELLGCFIASTLTDSIKNAMDMIDVPIQYWSDSTTALSWIKFNDDWGTFVGNRVKTICKLSAPQDWRYVPGKLNPADLPSRGCSPAELLTSKWWEGPEWLKGAEATWPSREMKPDMEAVMAEKKKKKTVTLLDEECKTPWYAKQASFVKNVTTVAWLKRFIDYVKKTGLVIPTGPLTVDEREAAERDIVRMVQRDTLPQDVGLVDGIHIQLGEGGLVQVKTKIVKGLSKDEEGTTFKHPAVLPHFHPITDQIIREAHEKNMHAGIQFLMAYLRERYWILRGRKAIRKIVRSCVICRRFSEKRANVIPAALPADRVTIGKVFDVIGVDLAGPMILKGGDKVWFVLFTCAVYRCIHLELVKSLSTEAFMNSFARFTSRRGRPSVVYSDNGTNFVGAENLMRELDWTLIERKLTMEKIRWKFNPPASPWWGGFWERLIRSIKDLLKRGFGKSKLTFDKLHTYLCECEAVINGRPLTTVTEDPEDLVPLTPAMFLHDARYPGITDRELLEASGFQKLLKTRDAIMEQFRQRFRKEYLSLLVHRGKEKKITKFKVGDIVLLGSDNKKRWQWPMARVIEVLPGTDNHLRLVRVKTANAEALVSVQRLIGMEISSPEEVPALSETVDADVNVFQRRGDSSQTPEERNSIAKTIEQSNDAPADVVTRFGRIVKTPDRYKP